jgi:hypothetical protein
MKTNNRSLKSLLSRWYENLGWLSKAISNQEPLQVLLFALNGQFRPMNEIGKRMTLHHYARKYELEVFVETGTFRGDTLDYLQPELGELYSVELSEKLHAEAFERFRGNEKIRLLQGDSGKVLRELIPTITKPALIWLDAHYSAKVTAHGDLETPILAELEAIFHLSKAKHIILIDDVRDFLHNPNYPSLDAVKSMALKYHYSFESRFELIRLLPK